MLKVSNRSQVHVQFSRRLWMCVCDLSHFVSHWRIVQAYLPFYLHSIFLIFVKEAKVLKNLLRNKVFAFIKYFFLYMYMYSHNSFLNKSSAHSIDKIIFAIFPATNWHHFKLNQSTEMHTKISRQYWNTYRQIQIFAIAKQQSERLGASSWLNLCWPPD